MRAFSHLGTNHRTKLLIVSRSDPTPPASPACILFIHMPYKAHNTNLKSVQPTSVRCFARGQQRKIEKKCKKILIKQTRETHLNSAPAITSAHSQSLATKLSRVAKFVDTGVWPVQRTHLPAQKIVQHRTTAYVWTHGLRLSD